MLRSRPFLLRLVAVLVTVLLLGAAAFSIYFSNSYPPSAEALAAMRSTITVTVTDLSDQIVFMPAAAPRAGLIFYPGARVQAAAYAARLKPVAEQGYAVFIVKMPLNLAVFGRNRAAPIIAAHPEIRKWAVGGHSVGGAFASAFLADRKDVEGLILYASYPAGDLSGRTDLVAVSIYGSNDALATVDRINNARATMPPQTRYVLIEGGNHSYFGDYGTQEADGIPTIPRPDAARKIVAATTAAMDELAGR
jgi:alpha/beta hydrolase family protein